MFTWKLRRSHDQYARTIKPVWKATILVFRKLPMKTWDCLQIEGQNPPSNEIKYKTEKSLTSVLRWLSWIF